MAGFSRITVIGVGLIGGSLARALKAAGACEHIVGCGRNEDNLRRAVELGVIDEYRLAPAEAVRGAELVMVCVPLGAMRRVFEAMAPGLDPGAIVTDAGSAKACVAEDARAVFADTRRVVPGHPIAGTEKSGVEASFEELYRRRRVILTPLAETEPAATARVRALWEAAGAWVSEMSPEHHDEVLAATSHLPHLLAYGLVDTLARWEDQPEIFRYAAGGFRDFTRIASSDPVMWRDICLGNRDALLSVLERYMADVQMLHGLVRDGDGPALERVFRSANEARAEFLRLLEQ
ncbi:prephenate dehydrogenase [Alkalilimnicola sp. S0819]|uniref:prephenate dehydrogenase n=1 Tax=Alkalilimnicola sp. S0819 TaxID=2613922 RepID=UPI001261DF63|nr:prephenate dehydrogenase/arogenate dehydrogenase family protein [Alkalilimnicola sp. S0819]KAB7623661.1 prephenate dehydrogenase/arogenate dehydrogenase family protein [Alkalilimnicola sp. S0819]MPQ16785.1 prephenate dehydrogenase/arogenate dehydrogenase family protein [Alkalilimnicola sp. S0819]